MMMGMGTPSSHKRMDRMKNSFLISVAVPSAKTMPRPLAEPDVSCFGRRMERNGAAVRDCADKDAEAGRGTRLELHHSRILKPRWGDV